MLTSPSLLFITIFLVCYFGSAESIAQTFAKEALSAMDRGQAVVSKAKTRTDYKVAASEFQKAVEYAPDWAEAYYNLGVASEVSGDYKLAVDSFKRYLILMPYATDAVVVRKRILKLEIYLRTHAK